MLLVNMGFYELVYKELKCRLCKKTFCCKDCRIKHEENVHDINSECDICIRGNIPISKLNTSTKLLLHIQQKHWPLHCVYCKKVYTSIEDFEFHNIACLSRPIIPEKLNSKTPLRIQQKSDFESPPMGPLDMYMGITSTPMNSIIKKALNVTEDITPVDASRMLTDPEPSAETTTETSKNKRKVTFISTPAVENVRRKPMNHENFLKVVLKSSMRSNESPQFNLSSYSMEKTNSCYTTMPEKSTPETIEQIKNETIELKLQASVKKTIITKKRRSYSMNETLWSSALNETIALQEVSSEIFIVDRKHNLSMDMNLKNNSFSDSFECSSITNTDAQCATPTPKTGVWSSMTSMFKNIVHGFNSKQVCKKKVLNASLKRHRSFADCDMEFDEQSQKMKRIKLCDVKCRPPIRMTRRAKFVATMDKSMQTDFVEDS